MICANATLHQTRGTYRPFQCPDIRCGRRFNRKYTLTEHVKTHTGERPHACRANGCGKRFSTSGNLSRHMRLHGAIEPVHCPVHGCCSKFMSDIKLANHMRSHYVPRTHTCRVPECGKLFSTTGNLNRHLKNQHTPQERELIRASASPRLLSSPCSTPTKQAYCILKHESPTSIDQEWGCNVWESVLEPVERNVLPIPLGTECTTPWTPEMLKMLSHMLFN
ncbi:unnamed protein product [Peronospora belbahrii]|nr:unnamed protein product [Peronospora belbahrii]